MRATVAVGHDTLWADDSGSPPGTAADAQVVVLLHPGIADSRSWDLVRPLLAERVRVIRYDARGYGQSPPPTAEYRQVDDLVAVLDHFGVPSAHLAGCSMGGGTAIDLALMKPDRVRSLTLLAPGVSGYEWPADPEVDAQEEAAIVAGEDALVELYLSAWAASGTSPLISDMMRSAVRAWPAEREFCLPAGPAFDRLSRMCAPSTLMVGDRDLPMLIECNEQIAARIDRCELIRLPGVDHLPALREPQVVADTILRQCGTMATRRQGLPRTQSK
jgi:pimeloyl-ACP methyl ester carboxylesterase